MNTKQLCHPNDFTGRDTSQRSSKGFLSIGGSARIVGLLREIAYRWRLLLCSPTLNRAAEIEREKRFRERQSFAEEYSKGYLEGWRECYAACLEAVEQEVASNNEVWEAGDLLVESANLGNAN